MVEVFVLLGSVCLAFAAGAVYGDLNKTTVDRAIVSLKAAEASAEAVLAKITAHKAS